ncbi:SURF1 family protein [Agrobacterium vitis]|uniref:SURF1 family protein n=1 Tax=Agrobacterium vitis TaxID=373 RepID=UPI0012E7E5CB|nr:SURF1 family protein [Agrobacterium vitis]MUZ63758.1 SURF1 family protein [Agrobacterium vitis]
MSDQQAIRRISIKKVALSGFLLLATALFIALGIWQIERLGWKKALIARVDARVHAEPVDSPSPAQWPSVNRDADEYRHIKTSGIYEHDKETLVYAATELGAGYWVMTPLKTEKDGTLLINRGFVPIDRKDPTRRAEGQIPGNLTVSGLLRISEPSGTLLRSNDANADRWYSRDVSAIAAKRNLTQVAPFFMDADKSDVPGGYPVGGLTQIRFPNSHLQYAITWFAMAAMSLAFLRFLLKRRSAVEDTHDM